MIHTGLDWSGDAGNPARTKGVLPILVVASATIATGDLGHLNECLDKVRCARRLPVGHPFHHVEAKNGVVEAFFGAIAGLPVSLRAHVIDKRDWGREYL